MRRRRNWPLWAGIGLCLLAAIVVCWPTAPEDNANPFWRFFRRDSDDWRASEQRVIAKTKVLDELIDGRINLSEAVNRCEVIYGEYPQATASVRREIERVFAGATY